MVGHVSVSALADAAFAEIEHRFTKPNELIGYQSGFVDLDEVFGGVRKGTVTIISGRPSTGSTTFARNLLRSLLDQNLSACAILLDNSAQEFTKRLMFETASLSEHRVCPRPNIQADLQAMAAARDKVAESRLVVHEEKHLDAAQLPSLLQGLEESIKCSIDVILIDGVNQDASNIISDKQSRDASLSTIRAVCRERNAIGLITYCLPRSVEKRQNKRPKLSDVFIANAADVALGIYRDEYYDPETKRRGEAEIIILRNRFGPVGTIELLYSGRFGKFSNKAT